MQTLSWRFLYLLHYVEISVDHHHHHRHQNVTSEIEVSQSVVWCGALQFRHTELGQNIIWLTAFTGNV